MNELTSIRPLGFARLSNGLAIALLATGLFGATAPSAAADDRNQISAAHKQSDFGFNVLREGDAIGHHSIDFTRRGDDLIVDVNIDLEVKFAFITVYRYTHRNQEIWRDGKLQSINTQTDDDGTKHWVKGQATDQGFALSSDSGNALLPSDVLPSSYWHPETPKAEALLNTQTGELAQIDVAASATKSDLPMPWGSQAARSFEVSGDVDLNLWYNDQGCLLKMNFAAPGDGSLIDYVPARHPAASSGPSLAGYPLIGDCVRLEMTSIQSPSH